MTRFQESLADAAAQHSWCRLYRTLPLVGTALKCQNRYAFNVSDSWMTWVLDVPRCCGPSCIQASRRTAFISEVLGSATHVNKTTPSQALVCVRVQRRGKHQNLLD